MAMPNQVGGMGGGRGLFKSGISGLDDIDKKLKDMEYRIESRVLKKAMKKALKIFRKPIRANTPRDRGILRKSLATRSKRARTRFGNELFGNVYFRYKEPYKAFHAHLVEYGTKAHFIKNYFGHKGVAVRVSGQKGVRMGNRGWDGKKRLVINAFKRELRQEVRRMGTA